MPVKVLVVNPNSRKEGIAIFSRVPCVGEIIEIKARKFKVLEVRHISAIEGNANTPEAVIIVS